MSSWYESGNICQLNVWILTIPSLGSFAALIKPSFMAGYIQSTDQIFELVRNTTTNIFRQVPLLNILHTAGIMWSVAAALPGSFLHRTSIASLSLVPAPFPAALSPCIGFYSLVTCPLRHLPLVTFSLLLSEFASHLTYTALLVRCVICHLFISHFLLLIQTPVISTTLTLFYFPTSLISFWLVTCLCHFIYFYFYFFASLLLLPCLFTLACSCVAPCLSERVFQAFYTTTMNGPFTSACSSCMYARITPMFVLCTSISVFPPAALLCLILLCHSSSSTFN